MVYKERFIAVVKCNGKILREHDDIVTLPFGAEYSILLKNLESRKASVSIQIDGKDILDGKALLVDPKSEFEIERFVESLDKGNRFKFIQKTKEIQDHRGDKIDDGIIRVEFTFEKEKPIQIKKTIIHEHHYDDYHHYHPPYRWFTTYGGTGSSRGIDSFTTYTSNIQSSLSDEPVVMSNLAESSINYVDEVSTPLEDEGITVKGSDSQQSFRYGRIGPLESQSHTIILRLRGTKSNGVTPVEKPITVKTRVTCPTCGRRSKSSAKFCNNCGTAIV